MNISFGEEIVNLKQDIKSCFFNTFRIEMDN